MVNSCCICKTINKFKNKSYYRIPKEVYHRNKIVSDLSKERRMKWCTILKLEGSGKKIDQIRICNEHFISGKPAQLLDTTDPDWIPSKNLSKEKIKSAPKKKVRACCRLCSVKLIPTKSKRFDIFDKSFMGKSLAVCIENLVGSTIVRANSPRYLCDDCFKKVKLCTRWIFKFKEAEERVLINQSIAEPNVSGIPESVKLETMSEEIDLKVSKLEQDTNENENENVQLLRRKYTKPKIVKLKPTEVKLKKCIDCFKKFTDVEDLKEHKYLCQPYFCKLCKPQVKFTSYKELVKHKETHKGLIVCHVCGKEYSQSYIETHFKNHFTSYRRCTICQKLVKNYVRHMSEVHEVRTSTCCHICGGTFKNLKQHLAVHESRRKDSPTSATTIAESDTML